jgi:phospholipase/lecithinase/hemolysin
MMTQKRVLPALLLSLFAGAAPSASAATFSNVYVFGDSLSDAGYFRPFIASLGLPAPLVATLGRFTTNPGPVWSELVANRTQQRQRRKHLCTGRRARCPLPGRVDAPGHGPAPGEHADR